ncbi:signal peptidase I [Streptococcus ovuberis]|uniref:Signal peptidase I n=2 Tax=Streptococcus ovuberis TaxID=1936207 RepID=A0A7X6N0L9_9STRE|nr:signal peptidase I [Streptococcus ovuberis]
MAINNFKKRSPYFSIDELPDSKSLEEEIKKRRYRNQFQQTLLSTVSILITVSAVSVLIATLWLPVLQIYGNSMSPTLEAGDIVVSLNTKSIEQGDTIAFYFNNKVLVKRVIAKSGQWVNIDDQGTVTVDGNLMNESYVKKTSKGDVDIELPYQVPEGKYFVMGDHRDVSVDSRNSALGPVGEEQIVGELQFRIWPLNRFGTFE